MIVELLIGYFAVLKPLAKELDNFYYEYDCLCDEVEDLKEEIEHFIYSSYVRLCLTKQACFTRSYNIQLHNK